MTADSVNPFTRVDKRIKYGKDSSVKEKRSSIQYGLGEGCVVVDPTMTSGRESDYYGQSQGPSCDGH